MRDRTGGTDVVQFQRPRLPYDARIEESFGVNRAAWKALVEAVFPLAKSPDSVVLALSYCKARNMDPFKRVVHIVPMWDSNKNVYVDTIWPSIAELRITAHRTGEYGGCDETEFGPLITEDFEGQTKNGKIKKTVTFPEWARLTVYRIRNGAVAKFVGPRVKWLESYATIGKTDVPNDMWSDRPEGQIEKCAEAAALRKAFPEELGNSYAAEEMEGKQLVAETQLLTSQPQQQPAAKAKHRMTLDDIANSTIVDAESSAPSAHADAETSPEDSAASGDTRTPIQIADDRGFDDWMSGSTNGNPPADYKGKPALIGAYQRGVKRAQREQEGNE